MITRNPIGDTPFKLAFGTKVVILVVVYLASEENLLMARPTMGVIG